MNRIFLLLVSLILFTGCDFEAEQQAESAVTTVAEVQTEQQEKSKFEIVAPQGFEQHLLPSGNGMVFTKTVNNQEKNPYSVEIGIFSEPNLLDYKNLNDFLDKRYVGYNYEFKGDELSDGVFVNELRGDKAVKHFFLLADDEIIEAYLEVPGVYFQSHEKEFLDIVDQLKF